MKPLNRHQPGIGHNKVLHVVVFVIAMTTFGLNGANAHGQDMRWAEYRAVAGMDQFDDVWQVAVAFRMRPPRRLRMNRFGLAVGAISTRIALRRSQRRGLGFAAQYRMRRSTAR